MITVEEAAKLVKEHSTPLGMKMLSTSDALGYVLAENVVSPINMPPFPQSAMDGYAIHQSDEFTTYTMVGEIAAGDSPENVNLKPGEAVRIFTGAPVPEGANTVVQQEIVEQNNGSISFTKEFKFGQHIRPMGEQINQGEVALETGTLITPGAVGFLYGLGITEVPVIKKPKVGIIATGNELVKPGNELTPGKIYESNSFMLEAALKQYNYCDVNITTVGDTFEATKQAIQEALKSNDVLLMSGGISVGDYDFVGKALIELGIEKLFYKVKQKPGKPLFFGKIEDKLIFALPGNPAAALTSFYKYVLSGLNILSGRNTNGLTVKEAALKQDYLKKGDRSQFLKANLNNGIVEVLEGQSSAMLHTYAISNSLVYIPSDKNEIKAGEKVTVMIL